MRRGHVCGVRARSRPAITGPQSPPPFPLFVQGGLEPIAEWEMLLCFASDQIPYSTSAAAKLLTGSFLKLVQPRGSGASPLPPTLATPWSVW